MCGIVGALAFSKSDYEITESYVLGLRDELTHRGPDDAGLWIHPNQRVGLGHRRLSIIDLSAEASQPMSNEDDTLWVNFNGEIYNSAEIRQTLTGHTWKTDHSDTEVLLHAFEEWGIDFLQKLRGMFAIALWDDKKRELWLIRDRIGMKPLYYSIHDQRIVFASEIKGLLRDPQQVREVNEQGLYHFLTFLTVPAPETMFAGIFKLPPGTWMRISENGDIHQQRYWDVLDHTQPLPDSEDQDIAEQVLMELQAAVSLRSISDVPVGLFVSGGIDSSTNAALFSSVSRWPVKTFSVGYQDNPQSYKNELEYARLIAEAIQADRYELQLHSDDALQFMHRMAVLQDEPIADPTCIPMYYLAKMARDHDVRVVQVGEGADELFYGYPDWIKRLRVQTLADMPFARSVMRLARAGMQIMGGSDRRRYEWLRRGIAGGPIFWTGSEGFGEEVKGRLLGARLRRDYAKLTSWDAIEATYARFKDKSWEAESPLAWMAYADLNLRLPELLLMRIDKMTMAAGLEARAPFLDHKLVELAFSIPQSVRARNGENKYILKKAVRGIIPDQIIDRRKQGFGIPLQDWFGDGPGWSYLVGELKSFCAETDYFEWAEVERLCHGRQGFKLWHLYSFVAWWRQFIA